GPAARALSVRYTQAPCSSFRWTAPSRPAIYTLSLHDALPISLSHPHKEISCRSLLIRQASPASFAEAGPPSARWWRSGLGERGRDRKSTRLNSSHSQISYAVFCLKKKKQLTSLSYSLCIITNI